MATGPMDEVSSKVLNHLNALVTDQLGAKVPIEERWLLDLQQYNGQYPPAEFTAITDKGGCTLFSNITRPKTNAWAARLADILFPADKKNWGITATPIPTLVERAQPVVGAQEPPAHMLPRMAEVVPQMAQPQPEATPEGMPPQGQAPEGQQQAAQTQPAPTPPPETPKEIAEKAARAMENLIEDQLVEAGYGAECRTVIRDGVKYGTGILKGPVASTKIPKRWGRATDGPEAGKFIRAEIQGDHPAFSAVSPWDFFADIGLPFTLERHQLTKAELRKLAKVPGFNKDQVRKVLESAPFETSNSRIAERQLVDGVYTTSNTHHRYTVWEYRGPLDNSDVVGISEILGKSRLVKLLKEDDPLTEVSVVVWFTKDTIINIGIAPLDSDTSVYSVFNFNKNETSVFGYGVPYLLRGPQQARNAAYRMMIDNAALSTGNQIVIKKGKVSPQDGSWKMAPRKVWLADDDMATVNDVFTSFSIDSHQVELLNILKTTGEMADDEINLPELSQGGSGAHQTTTAQGMSILQNNAALPLRDLIKAWDDDITIPAIGRCFDWNMQFSHDDAVKGDATVYARGSSVLLVQEMQAQSLMALCTQFGAHPVFGPMVNWREVLGQLFQAHMISVEAALKTEEELEKQAAAQKPQPAPEEIKAQAMLQATQLVAQAKLEAEKMAAQAKTQVAQIQTEAMREKTQALVAIDDADNQTRIQVANIQHDGTAQNLHAKVAIAGADTALREKDLSIKTALATRKGANPGGLFEG